jgi:hypothetical protein
VLGDARIRLLEAIVALASERRSQGRAALYDSAWTRSTR